MIPRLVANHAQNERFNSQVRPISKTVELPYTEIRLSYPEEEQPTLHKDVLPPTQGNPETVRVEQSTLFALTVSLNAFLYVSIGRVEGSGKLVIALSNEMASKIVPAAAVTCDRHPRHCSSLCRQSSSPCLCCPNYSQGVTC